MLYALLSISMQCWVGPADAFVVTPSAQQRQRPSHQQRPPQFLSQPPPTLHPPPQRRSNSQLHSVSTVLSTLHSDPTYISTALFALSYFGIQLEGSTQFGKAISAPLATMGLALLLANIKLLPFDHALYGMVNQYGVALAVPLLLFDSNLRKVLKNTGSLLLCFLVGCVGTVVGTLGAMSMVNIPWKVASALAARHIGGAINFVAVAETLNIPGSLVSSAIAADNIVVALYFLLLFALSTKESTNTVVDAADGAIQTQGDSYSSQADEPISLSSIALSLSVSSSLVLLGKFATRCLLPAGTSALPLTSLFTVVAATVCSNFFGRLRNTGSALGIFFIQLFFACSGASGSIALVLKQAPMLFVFSVLQIAIHFGFINCFRGLLRPNELYLASNANVGGTYLAK